MYHIAALKTSCPPFPPSKSALVMNSRSVVYGGTMETYLQLGSSGAGRYRSQLPKVKMFWER